MTRSDNSSTTTLIAVALLLLILFVSVGSLTLLPDAEKPLQDPDLISELLQNLQAWEKTRPLSYRYVVQRSCACQKEDIAAFVATEERGQRTSSFVVSVESSSGEFLSAPPNPVWIEDIFDALIKATKEGSRPLIEVVYDNRYHFPVLVNIQYTSAAASVQYEIRDFEVLEHRLPL